MKSFIMWKMPILVGGLGAALLLSPSCKAQSEIAPDHFDGTDSWETAYRTAAPKPNKTNHERAAMQSKSRQSVLIAAAQSPASGVVNPAAQDSVAITDRRKTAIRKSKKQ
jgi:hypothetical protein